MQLTANNPVVAATAQRRVSALPNLCGRIPELDGLRGLAILLVVICHHIASAEHAPLGFWPHRILSALTIGWSGVDLFFVLSGFLIGGILLDARNCPHYFRPFYMRRVFRILPIYYLWTLIYAALIAGALWILPSRFPVAPGDLQRVPLQLLFLQNMFYAMTPFQWKWFSVTWSLAVEEHFYLVTPLLIRFLSVRRLVFILVAIICLVPVLRVMVLRNFSQGSLVAVLATPCRADALASGVLLAVAWREDWFRPFLAAHRLLLQRTLLALFLGVGALLWWLAHPVSLISVSVGYTWLAMFYSCLLLVALSHTQGWIAAVMRWRVLRGLGTISYCVYLIHLTINYLAHQILLRAPPQVYNEAGLGVTLLSAVLTLAVASLSWRYFEKPLIRRGHTYLYEDEPLV
jgi:peptidoglycan/LPS O-acetylase OafA/YrhL